MSTVAVIDYGMGNLHSVSKALEKADPARQVQVTADPEQILGADHVILPGVGAIRDCMAEIRRLELEPVILQVAEQGTPLLGVCVGMQAMMEYSAENDGTRCLGLLPGKVQSFPGDMHDPLTDEWLKVPHMGWNQVYPQVEHPLWQNIAHGARFYFVHSYYVEPASPDLIAASSNYGIPFTCALAKGNVFAVQFHPEKSQHAGLQLYTNFLNWDGAL
ncbi:imidazole glycerol phosphate synthase subunit HisH [Thiohalophilus sp.]|uniref:imidazole glycerol phosphate synthase subunit HisH n=1 Tax=Thiohalophilus sp. TaxID=3028392 RepID=UPI0039755951